MRHALGNARQQGKREKVKGKRDKEKGKVKSEGLKSNNYENSSNSRFYIDFIDVDAIMQKRRNIKNRHSTIVGL